MVQAIPLRRIQIALPNLNVLVVISKGMSCKQGHAGNKTLLQQNPPVLT